MAPRPPGLIEPGLQLRRRQRDFHFGAQALQHRIRRSGRREQPDPDRDFVARIRIGNRRQLRKVLRSRRAGHGQCEQLPGRDHRPASPTCSASCPTRPCAGAMRSPTACSPASPSRSASAASRSTWPTCPRTARFTGRSRLCWLSWCGCVIKSDRTGSRFVDLSLASRTAGLV